MLLFFLVLFSVILGCDLVAWKCLDLALAALGLGAPWHHALAAFMLVQIVGFVGLIAGRFLGGQPGSGMGKPLLSLVMLWGMLFALPTAVLSGLWALLHLVAPLPALPPFAGAALVFLAPALTVLGTVVSLRQLDRFRVLRLDVPIPGLPPALDGLRIAHVSDLHVGKLTSGPVLDRMTGTVNRLDADLVLVTGDLVNTSLSDLPRALEVLEGMKARHGLFACEGNHDLIESRADFERSAKASRLAFLLDEAATVAVAGHPVRIVGLRWGGSAEERLAALLPDDGAFPIVLAHHPDLFDAAARAGVPLTLAGHTHGGQLNLTRKIGFGPRLYRYWSGLYAQGAHRLVVSNGAGNWFPLRLGAPAEIGLLTLRRA